VASQTNVRSTTITRTLAPGPPGRALFGNLREFGRDTLGFLLRLHRQYGGVVRFQLGPKVVHLVTDPALAKVVLQERYKNYRKGAPYARARFAFGEGLITSDGAKWRRHRKLIQPLFHKDHYARFAEIMSTSIVGLLDRWESAAERARPVDIAIDLRNLALKIAARTLFSTDLDEDADWLQDAFNQVQLWFTRGSRTAYLIPPSFPLPANLRLRRTLRALDGRIYPLIAQRRAMTSPPMDLLQLLLEARDEEDGTGLSDAELRDEVMTLLLAAHESTGTTIAWSLVLLSRYPDVARRVREEIARVLGGRAPTFAELHELPYTRMVSEETMRLYPAAPIIPREVVDDDELGGYEIPGGSVVFLSPYVTHRDPATWDNPEAFDPDRFAPTRVEARHRFAYMPFVLGPRQCIGNHFAMTEMLLALPMILQRFEPELIPGLPIASAHMRFDEGVLMTLRRRAREPARPGE
jgi:cytochrome P450